MEPGAGARPLARDANREHMAAMDFESWDKDEAGRLKVWPLQAFTTAIFDGTVGAVRLEVGRPKPGLPTPAVQVSAPADLLRALAAALAEVADAIEGEAPADGGKAAN